MFNWFKKKEVTRIEHEVLIKCDICKKKSTVTIKADIDKKSGTYIVDCVKCGQRVAVKLGEEFFNGI